MASPIKVNADGTLTEDVVGYFEGLCEQALESMERDDELSAFEVIINPTQNVISTGKLAITIKLIPIGTADVIEVEIGFTTAL